MNVSPFPQKRSVISTNALLYKRFAIKAKSNSESSMRFMNPYIIAVLLLCFTFSGYTQRNKDVKPVIYCVKDLGNGLHQASFGYHNPTNKEVTVGENDSKIKINKGKKVIKGLAKFKKGSHSKVFTKEFGPGDYVEWTIINRKGKAHTVIANANSAKKCAPDDGFIVPVIGNGKTDDIYGIEGQSFCLDLAGTIPTELIYQTKTDNGILKVLVEIVPKQDEMSTVLGILQGTLGVQNNDFLLDPSVYDYNNYSSIDVFLDKPTICELNNLAQYINFVRPVYPTYNSSGGVLSQGDAAQTSDKVKEAFRAAGGAPIDGTGITVRVVSDSYDMLEPGNSYAAIGEANGELPHVTVLNESRIKATDEGRAMIEIIHDVAPGAAIQFSSGMSPNDFIAGVDTSTLDCDIIVDDITFITEPFFESGLGRVAEAIKNSGKLHYTSAGNLANKAVQGIFNPTLTMPSTNFIDPASSTVAHDFDPSSNTDYLQKISVVPGTYLIALQYKNDAASQYNDRGALDDLDIYIVDDLGRLLVGSNRVNIAGDPTEIVVFRATGTGEANIMITSANGPTNVPFRYIAFRTTAEDGTPDGLKFEEYFGSGAPTITGHGMKSENSLNVLTTVVGAVDFRNADAPVAEYFSSHGGIIPDGTNLITDLYAPDGTNTSFFGQFSSNPDAPPKFFGTSASAPHAAASMALLQSALPDWHPPTDEQLAADPTIKTSYTAAQALAAFKTTTTEFSVAPPPGSTGGLLNSIAAFKSIAAQSPNITKLVVLNDAIPSAEPFTVMIIGDFFPDNVEDVTVLFDGQPLEDVAYSTGDDGERVVTASVPIFTGNPTIQVVANSITEGYDGSGGDTSTFFPDGKIALSIIAKNTEFEYAQDIGSYYRPDISQPDYIPSYTVQGLPDGETFESLDLPPIVLVNSALDNQLAGNGYPIVADYVITPSLGDQVLTQEQLDKYQINFIAGYNDEVLGKHGYLTIAKKNLTIKLAPLTVTYGDAILNTLLYEYDPAGISDNSQESGFYSFIESSHQSDYKDGLPNKFQAVVSKFQAVVSGYPNLLEYFDGGSWSASERTIQNKFQAVVSTMNIINLDNENFTNYIDARAAYDGGTTNKFQAVVSKFQAVVSAEDLFTGVVDLGIENKFQAVVSKFQAVVSTDDPTRPYSGYDFIYAIIDAEDAPPEDGSDDERAISDMFALNMITGLEVTPEDEPHYVYPGALLNSMKANLNITYIPGNLIVLPKILTGSIENLTIPYGEVLTLEKLNLITDFEGWAFEGDYKESAEIVFPDGVPYYFTKVGGDGTELELHELKDIGDYECRFRNPQNYVINHINDDIHGIVTISPTVLTIETANFETPYGQNFTASDLTTIFGDFAYESESTETVFPDGVPYYFVDDDLNEYELDDRMDVGSYQTRIRGTEEYLMEYGVDHGLLTIIPAALLINTTELNIEYGDDIEAVISTDITGFASGETIETIFPDGIRYIFVDDLGTEFDLESIRELGIYSFNVLESTTSSNYEIFYADDHGLLTILPRLVKVRTENINEKYGYYTNLADLTTQFIAFAPDETVADVFGSSGIPYYFVNAAGSVFNLGDELALGEYSIKLEETNDHYSFEYDASANVLSISKNTLMVTIDDLTITEGDIPVFNSTIEGFVYGESVATVFPGGIQYYIVDENGNEKDFTDTGLGIIKIIAPDNYDIEYIRQAKLNVEAKLEQIKIYLDCVENHYHHHHHNHYDKLKYTATFRYVNPNDKPVIVNIGSNNSIYGYGRFDNDVPTVFLPGENTFEIRFDGRTILWKLKSYEGSELKTDKAYAKWYSKRCDRSSCKDDDDYNFNNAFVIYPNPVKDWLQIEQNISEVCTIEIYNMYGMLYKQMQTEPKNNQTISIDLSNYSSGPYIVRITLNGESRVYNIIKE